LSKNEAQLAEKVEKGEMKVEDDESSTRKRRRK